MKPKPYSVGDLMARALAGGPLDPMRVLATFAHEDNWVQLYDGTSVGDYEPKPCEWAFIGPVRPPYELAQRAIVDLVMEKALKDEPPPSERVARLIQEERQ